MKLLAMVSALVALASTAPGQSDPTFVKANEEFAKGQFKEAIRDYQSLVEAKEWTAPLFYNLGNAYFRAGDAGKAILSYERALALDPYHPESAANLALVREEARALELQRGRFDALLKHATSNQLIIIAAASFWVGAFGFAGYLFGRRRATTLLMIAVLSCVITAVCLMAVYQIETTRKALAIVTGPEVQARLATAESANSVLQLPPGSEVRILSRRGDWIYALLPNNLRGWIPTTSVEPVLI
jgi:tetratricopeptide (TPR) repeat protein